MARVLTAAKLDRRLTVLRTSPATANALNEIADDWPAAFTCWASRNDLSDRELGVEGGQMSALTTRLVVRSSTQTKSITSKDRLSVDGHEWNILGVKEADFDIRGRSAIEITASTRSDG